MKIDIDRSGCIGCGLCVNTCPAVFRMADDGMAEVIAQPQGELEPAAEEDSASFDDSVSDIISNQMKKKEK